MSEAPYAQAGKRGTIIYMVTYSQCGNCILFMRDFWDKRRDQMQLREILAPLQQTQFLNEAADIALTRNDDFAEQYYKRLRTAPAALGASDRMVALSKVVAFNTEFHDFLKSIGHVQDAFPTFVLRAKDTVGRDRVVIVSGWGPDFGRSLEQWANEANNR